MQIAVRTQILITILLWGLCVPVHGMFYVVIMKTHVPEKRLAEILSRPLTDQEWQQLILLPLTGSEGNEWLDQLETLLPEIKFNPETRISSKMFFTGKNPKDESAFYLSWLIHYEPNPDENPTNIQTPFSRLLPEKPVTAILREPPVKSILRTTDQPGQSTLMVFKPQLSGVVSYRLHHNIAHSPSHYVLTQPHTKSPPEDISPGSLSERLQALTLGAQAAGLMPKDDNNPASRHKQQPLKHPKATKLVAPIETPQHSSIIKSELKFLSPYELIAAGTQVREDVRNWGATAPLRVGNFGTIRVYKPPSSDQKPLVVKKILSSRAGYKFLSREASYLHSLQHKNIVQFHGIAIEDINDKEQKLWVSLEYFPDRDMSYQIQKNPTLFTEKNIKKIIRDVATAIEYLHGQNIAHRDLKPSNILLEVDHDIISQVKLTDFGFATSAAPEDTNVLTCGSPQYAPPERLRDDFNPCLKKGDIWGIGVTFYVGLTRRKHLYENYPHSLEDVSKFVAWRKTHPEEEIGEIRSTTKLQRVLPHLKHPESATDLIQQCCHTDWNKRPDINAVLMHPFLAITPSKTSK